MKTMSLFLNNLKNRVYILSFFCSFFGVGQENAGILDTTFNSRFPRLVQPYFGSFVNLNTEGTTDKVANFGFLGGAHFDFWRLHATVNLSRFNSIKNDDGFLDNIWNKELSFGMLVSKRKDVGLALIGCYDEGKRPVVMQPGTNRSVQFIDNETGMPTVNETGVSEKTFLFELKQPFYGAGLGLIVKNNRKSAFFELSVKYLFILGSGNSTVQKITTSPYNINVPRSLSVEGLGTHKQGVVFRTAYTAEHLGFNFDIGTRPVLYSDYTNKDDKLGAFGRSLLIRFSVYFKVF